MSALVWPVLANDQVYGSAVVLPSVAVGLSTFLVSVRLAGGVTQNCPLDGALVVPSLI